MVICKLRSEGTTTERSRQHWRAAKALLVIFPLLGMSCWILRLFYTNWNIIYFFLNRHFLYYYLNGSYRGNSWTSGLPIRQSFFAVYSGLYFSNNTNMSYFIIVMFGPSPPLILKSLNSLELSVSHDQIDRYMVLD